MKVYTNNNFSGHWPVGTAAVVIARDREDAATQLAEALTRHGLPQPVKPEEMLEFQHEGHGVRILCDGNY